MWMYYDYYSDKNKTQITVYSSIVNASVMTYIYINIMRELSFVWLQRLLVFVTMIV